MKRKFLLINILFIAVVVLVLEIITFTPQDSEMTTTSRIITTSFDNKSLLKEIQSFAEANKTEPIDATVDRVWKAIPGYNGLAVDIETSYLNMSRNNTFDEKRIVYEEVSPEIHLEDLPPSPIYKGNPEKSMVTLLINVAWGDEFIPTILDTLKQQQVQATFFFDGSWVKKNPVLAKDIYDAGHEIGNHAYSHPDLKGYGKEQTVEELQKTNDVIEETIGVKPTWFAPPSGSFNEQTITTARELGMMTILWTADTVDWKKPETSEMVTRVVNQVENGTMILMHPTKPVAEGLGQMIESITKKGYQIGTVSDMMSEERMTKDR